MAAVRDSRGGVVLACFCLLAWGRGGTKALCRNTMEKVLGAAGSGEG